MEDGKLNSIAHHYRTLSPPVNPLMTTSLCTNPKEMQKLVIIDPECTQQNHEDILTNDSAERIFLA